MISAGEVSRDAQKIWIMTSPHHTVCPIKIDTFHWNLSVKLCRKRFASSAQHYSFSDHIDTLCKSQMSHQKQYITTSSTPRHDVLIMTQRNATQWNLSSITFSQHLKHHIIVLCGMWCVLRGTQLHALVKRMLRVTWRKTKPDHHVTQLISEKVCKMQNKKEDATNR